MSGLAAVRVLAGRYLADRNAGPLADARIQEALAILRAHGGRVHLAPNAKGTARTYEIDARGGLYVKGVTTAEERAKDGIALGDTAAGERVHRLILRAENDVANANAVCAGLLLAIEAALPEVAEVLAGLRP